MIRSTYPMTVQQSVEASPDRQFAEPTPPEANSISVSRWVAIGFFSNLSDAEYAVTGLRSVGFPLSQIILVANQFRRQDQFDGVDLCTHLEGLCLGIFAEQVRFYQDRLDGGEYMVIVHGTEDELNCAASIFNHHRIQEWQMYDITTTQDELSLEASQER